MPTIRCYSALAAREEEELPAGAWRLGDGSAETYLFGPAFFDHQVNGFGGVDFQDPDLTREGLESATRLLQASGCSHFLLTLITAAPSFLEEQCRRIDEFIRASRLLTDTIPGLHLEGPFISSAEGFVGAHPREHVHPAEWALFERWQRASGGRIRMITLAPEVPRATEIIAKASAAGVFVALGHSDADLDTLRAAQAAGARLFAHLGNGCPQHLHRYDNIIQRVLSIPDLFVSLVPDGLHVPPPALSNVVRALGPSRVVFVTDASSPAGATPGAYQLGSLQISLGSDRVVRVPGQDHYAGSSLTPAEGFYNAVRCGGISADLAWHACTRMRSVLFPGMQAPTLALPWHDGRPSTMTF
jgi:N-acetylglucosamine-6-phosphate deacetylase